MVSLVLDPPPSPRGTGRPPPRGGSRLALSLLVLAVASAGFVIGRWTAPGGRFAVSVSRKGAAAARADAGPAGSTGASGPTVAQALGDDQAQAVPAPAPAPAPDQAAPPAAAAVLQAPALTGPRHLATELVGPLEEAIARAMPSADAGFAERLTQVVNRLLVWDLQVSRDARRGDRIEVVYEPPPAPGPDVASTREPVVHAVRFASQKLNKVIAIYRFKPPGSRWPHYYRPDGSELEERLVTAPVADYDMVTSLLRDGRRHKGVDFRTPVGTPVYATFDGVIERRNWNFAGNGNCLDVRDAATGRHAIYLHLEVLPKDMQPGRAVKKGEQIALSGNSGHSFAPHLHYQMEDANGTILDPFAIQPTRRAALEKGHVPAFDSRRAALDAALSGGSLAVLTAPAPAPAVAVPAVAVPAAAAPAR